MTNRTTLRKQPFAHFIALSLFLFLATAILAPVSVARADNLSEGLELYQQKKFREATPYLEKAAQEGHEEAIVALDVIYAADVPVVPTDDKATKDKKGKKGKKADEAEQIKAEDAADDQQTDDPQADQAEGKAQPEKADVAEDQKAAEDRSFMRKLFFLGTAVLIFLMWIVQYFLFKKLKNQNFRKMTPEELAAEAKKNEKKK